MAKLRKKNNNKKRGKSIRKIGGSGSLSSLSSASQHAINSYHPRNSSNSSSNSSGQYFNALSASYASPPMVPPMPSLLTGNRVTLAHPVILNSQRFWDAVPAPVKIPPPRVDAYPANAWTPGVTPDPDGGGGYYQYQNPPEDTLSDKEKKEMEKAIKRGMRQAEKNAEAEEERLEEERLEALVKELREELVAQDAELALLPRQADFTNSSRIQFIPKEQLLELAANEMAIAANESAKLQEEFEKLHFTNVKKL
jgi:hypothetical protein